MIFDLFKRNTDNKPTDVKGIRYALLQFIKHELQKAEGGEGSNIKGLCLYLACSDSERHMYEAAVYVDEPDKFKDEVQKIADDYAVELPASWNIDVNFEDEFPAEAVKVPQLDAAFSIKTSKHFIKQTVTAYIITLNGDTGEQEYILKSDGGKVNIGRDRKAQVNDGFFRTNQIAFPSDSSNESNKYVSRQHAHLEWNSSTGHFMIFADDGGVPPRNKIKIKSEQSEALVKLHSTHIGHQLTEGDQIVLGESAVLEFSYRPLGS